MKYTAIAKELGVSDDIARSDCLTGLAVLRQLLTLNDPAQPAGGA